MKTKITKVLALTLCAVLLVVGSVMGTVAYLTSTDTVQNTFTYGNVAITMDEAKTNAYGVNEDPTARTKNENKYKLIPGQTYTKNTTIHVAQGSEACYLFVKLDSRFASGSITLNFNGSNWKKLDGVDYVYYYEVTVDASATEQDIVVLDSFTVNNGAQATDIEDLETPNGNYAKIIAYAVQKSGFTDVKAAWDNTFGAPTTPGQ